MVSGIKIVAIKEPGVLRPWGEHSVNEFDRIPFGKKLSIEVRQPRYPEHLNKYWLILTRAAANLPGCEGPDELHEDIKIKLRMFKEYQSWDGKILIRTKSISVESMDQIKFSLFYDRAIWVLGEWLGIDPNELLDGERHTEAA